MNFKETKQLFLFENIAKYKTFNINNRRYLGNKYHLLPFIKDVIKKECKNINSVADIFSGTGSFASAYTDKILTTNDLLYCNYISHCAWFSPKKYNRDKIISYISDYNSLEIKEDNYMTENFANTYFSFNDCSKIGYIREDIEKKFKNKKISFREKALLITSLIYAMDKIANTCGHYDAYRKVENFDLSLELAVPLANITNNPKNRCFNIDANDLVINLYSDLIYIDPPYNSRQYCDSYHLLENVALWQKPKVFGVAKKMDRQNLKSDYSTKNATKKFADLIDKINARYILLSYNNMANKGNDRSNAKISDGDILNILSKKGNVKIFSEDYKSFSTGKSNIKDNKERLFLCECK